MRVFRISCNSDRLTLNSLVQEVIAQMTELREIMRRNYENGVADRIQQRWCSGDSEWLFRERWEKLFDDFVGIKQEKFDPSRVSEAHH